MRKLQAMGLEGDRWMNESVAWELKTSFSFDGIEMMGKQVLSCLASKEKERSATATTEKFSRHMGKLLSFQVPPPAQLCAVRDTASLLEAWRQEPLSVPEAEVIQYQVRLCSPYFDLEPRVLRRNTASRVSV
ncbi:hypothetical protein PHYPSEUDO_015492 [Phytophthora pseudosyringae]|uniref:Uncharacterized protein n=1 Tax=Phytophthora pseudosyringae TaxID=221518 RepID=A0A8T1W3J0_9STRA|nr:hypothetical protein PHYPSEUDO_015492 [Phytophthora pseudosyringae]